MTVIREHRSRCRSVEAAWGGSDTKTALVQTDKHVCLSASSGLLPEISTVVFENTSCIHDTKRQIYEHDCCALLVPKCSTLS